MGESLGSHSMHSFAEFLQRHIESPEASSCLTSRRKPFTNLKPIRLNPMATEKSARKGGRQHHGNTALDLPPDLYELYKSDPEESYTQRKNIIQWIRRYWAEQWFKYNFLHLNMLRITPLNTPGEILFTRTWHQRQSLKLLLRSSIHAWSEDLIQIMPTHHLFDGVVIIISSSATRVCQGVCH